jgi:hypothetical protein
LETKLPPPSIEYSVAAVASIVIVPSLEPQLVISVLVADTIAGNGLMVIVKLTGIPGQGPKTGVMVIVDVMAEPVVLAAVKLGRSPVPFAPRPMAVLLFVQLNVTPDGVPDKLVTGTVTPAHAVILAGAIAVGVGSMVMV